MSALLGTALSRLLVDRNVFVQELTTVVLQTAPAFHIMISSVGRLALVQ